MKEIFNKIIFFLDKEKIKVLYFNNIETQDVLFEEPVELAIQIGQEDMPKWEYFNKKTNCCGKIIDMLYSDNILKFIFVGTNSECEKDLLKRNLEIFYNNLLKRYFTVCPSKQSFSIIVKPTHRCNLDCKYCYDKPHREKIKEDMSMETLDRILKLLSEYTEKVQFVWHGGEPTLVGVEWYEKAYKEVISKYPMIEIKFSLMSNGTMYNDKWFELFKKYEIRPGASYNAYCQAQIRCSSQVVQKETIDLKLSEKIKGTLISWEKRGNPIGVIDVINRVNYKNQIEIYEYYKKIGVGVSLNNIFHTKQAQDNNLELSAKEFSEEFLKYFKYWLYDKEGVYERSAIEALAVVIGATNELTCRYSDCRYKWLGINPLGEVYPCDRYYPEKYKIGNLSEFNSFNELFNSDVYQTFSNEVEKRCNTICKKCGYWFACKGGCNGSAYESSGSCEGVEEFQCESLKLKYIGVYEILRDLDWVGNENINPHARRLFINKSFYSISEIKKFMKDMKMNFRLEYDKNKFLECSEYQVFRGINFMNDEVPEERHVNFIDGYEKNAIKKNNNNRKKELLEYIAKLASDIDLQKIFFGKE